MNMGNLGLLSGIFGGMDQSERDRLIAFISSMSEHSNKAVTDVLAKAELANYKETNQATALDLFKARFSQLPQEVRSMLAEGSQQVMDSEIYSVVILSDTATSIDDLFAPDGAKVVGLRNIANQKLDAGKYFLVTAIEIMFGTDATHSGLDADFSTTLPKDLLNGEIEITQNGRQIVTKQSLHMVYNGMISTSIAVGPLTASAQNRSIIKLAAPKWLYPQQEIKGRIILPHATGTANGAVKIRLIGVANERA